MNKKRKQHSSEVKAKVALATVQGDETVPQLAARHGLHPTQINTWKKQLTGGFQDSCRLKFKNRRGAGLVM